MRTVVLYMKNQFARKTVINFIRKNFQGLSTAVQGNVLSLDSMQSRVASKQTEHGMGTIIYLVAFIDQ